MYLLSKKLKISRKWSNYGLKQRSELRLMLLEVEIGKVGSY